MKKINFGIIGVAALVVCMIGLAWATSPHFIKVTASGVDCNTGGCIQVSWKEAGLGNNVRIDYTVSADATATYQCVNNGGNCPSAANKQSVEGPVSTSGFFFSGNNGSINASLFLCPPPPEFECPGGLDLKLLDVTYSHITVTDTTNNIQGSVPGHRSATCFTCP